MDLIILRTLEDALCLSKIYVISFSKLLVYINEQFKDVQPSNIIFYSILTFYLSVIVVKHIVVLYKGLTLKNIRNLPIIRTIVEKKLNKIGIDIRKDLIDVYNNEEFLTNLPKKQTSPEILLKKIRHYSMFDTSNWQLGRISGAIYTNNSPRFNEILLSVYGTNMWSNPLHSDVFAGVRKMESEIVRMIASMYKGNEKVIGSVTSGGTESIIMACKAYRDYRSSNSQAEIIAPITAHAAFEKAANLLNCKIIHIPVDKKTLKVDLKKMRQAITKNTCMLVGSAPQFPHGIIDPIEEIGKLGLAYGVPVHVDACLGGFLIPFMSSAGYELDEKFDFSVPGVTSISADTHKYGFAPKGTSVILYSDRKYIHHQYSIQTDWPGGIYASPTIPGSRPGALIATCWAAMMYHGLEGYIEATRKIITTTRWIKEELQDVDGLEILGNPLVSVLAFKSNRFDVYTLNGRLKELGWNLNALQFPSAFHLCVTLMHTNNNVANSFVKDVKKTVQQLLLEPKSKATGTAAIYGMAQTIPDRSLVAQICTKYLDGCLGY